MGVEIEILTSNVEPNLKKHNAFKWEGQDHFHHRNLWRGRRGHP